MLDGQETHKFTVMEEAEGHTVVTIIGSDMMGRVVVLVETVVIGIKVVGAPDSTKGFSINLTLYCLLPACLFLLLFLDSLVILFIEACNFWGDGVLGLSG